MKALIVAMLVFVAILIIPFTSTGREHYLRLTKSSGRQVFISPGQQIGLRARKIGKLSLAPGDSIVRFLVAVIRDSVFVASTSQEAFWKANPLFPASAYDTLGLPIASIQKVYKNASYQEHSDLECFIVFLLCPPVGIAMKIRDELPGPATAHFRVGKWNASGE